MNKIAFLYAGQGSQVVGMGKDFYEEFPLVKETFDQVDLGFNVAKLCFEGPIELLSQTEFTQPSMVTFAVAITKLLKAEGIHPDMAAGLSLGEYSALYCGGVFQEKEVKELARFRGKVMTEAAKGITSKMVAVLGLDQDKVILACKSGSDLGVVEISNLNCPGQIVIGGEIEAVDKAVEEAINLGAKRCLQLKVSGPFHTSLMESASIALRDYFEKITFGTMKIPIIFNATGKELEEESTISDMLVRQVKESVHFQQTVEYLASCGITTIVEIGPGKVLSGFVKKINKEIKLYQIQTVEDYKEVVVELKK